MLKKLFALFFSGLTILAFVGLFLHKISVLAFWVIIGCAAFVAYVVFPKWNEEKNETQKKHS